MNETISIIIPVYRVEKYLKRCVESVKNQSYRNIEIILVDDGSPDTCPQICDELALQDDRILVIHKENGGLSSARNAGIEAAAGAYIGFVDSDDYIAPDMYEKLYTALKEDEADLCICNVCCVDEKGDLADTMLPGGFTRETLSREQAYERIGMHWSYVTAWNKLYKKEIFENLRFPEGRIHEDEFTVHYIFERCKNVSCIPDALYMYVQTSNSIMRGNFHIKRLDGVYACLDRYRFFKEKKNQRLAHMAIRGAYGVLAGLIGQAGYWKYRKEFNAMLKQVLPGLVRYGDLRAVKLVLVCGGVC